MIRIEIGEGRLRFVEFPKDRERFWNKPVRIGNNTCTSCRHPDLYYRNGCIALYICGSREDLDNKTVTFRLADTEIVIDLIKKFAEAIGEDFAIAGSTMVLGGL